MNRRQKEDNRTVMGAASKVLVLGGAVGLSVSLALLPYMEGAYFVERKNGSLEFGHGAVSLWAISTRESLVLTCVAALAVGFVMVGFVRDWFAWPLLATCLSFWLLGQVFFVGYPNYQRFAVGFWFDCAAAIAMAVGSLLAVFGSTVDASVQRPYLGS